MKEDLRLISWHQIIIVFITGTSSKMASTLSQKWFTIFCQETQKFVYFWLTILFKCHQHVVQIRLKIMYGVCKIKCLILKWFFATNFECKTLPCKRYHWKSKVSPYIIWHVFGPRADEILSFLTENRVYLKLNYRQSFDTIMEDVPVAETIVES